MDLKAIDTKLEELESRWREWSAPIDAVIKENASRINRNGFTLDHFMREVQRTRQEQKSEQDIHQDAYKFLDFLCAEYLTAPIEQCAQIRTLFERRKGLQSALLTYAYRAAEQIDSSADPCRLNLGLAAVSIEDCAVDYRDTLLALAELYVASEQAGISPQPYLDQIACRSNDCLPKGGTTPTAEMLVNFAGYAVVEERRRTRAGR